MRTISIVKYVFTLVGLGMLIGAFTLYNNTQGFIQNSLVTDGRVVALASSRTSDSTIYRPVVEFNTREGSVVEFTSSSGSNPPSYSEGEIVEVLYQEATPEQAKINAFFSLWGGATILASLGAVFFLVGFSIVLFGSLKGKKLKYLKHNGTVIKAKLQSVEVNHSLNVNGRNPYQIFVQWKNPATNELHLFNSENIWFDPTDHIIADELTVLIDQENPKKYHVDVSFLPDIAA